MTIFHILAFLVGVVFWTSLKWFITFCLDMWFGKEKPHESEPE